MAAKSSGETIANGRFEYTVPLAEPIDASIVVDADETEWNAITAVSIGDANVFDLASVMSNNKLYCLARGSKMNERNYFYIDSDNNASTGFQVWAWPNSGADYLLNNYGLFQHTGDSDDWSWNYISSATVELDSSYNVAETSVLLSDIGITSPHQVKLGYCRMANDSDNDQQFAPMRGRHMAAVTKTIKWDSGSPLAANEEYLEDIAAETKSKIENGNSLTYLGKTFNCNRDNSRSINGRIAVDMTKFAEFITSSSEVADRINKLSLIGNSNISGTSISIEPAAYGEYSENIRELQDALITLGYWTNPDLEATGYFGEVTKESLINYEREYLLMTDDEISFYNGSFVNQSNTPSKTNVSNTTSNDSFLGVNDLFAADIKRVTMPTVDPVGNFLLGAMVDAPVSFAKDTWDSAAHPVRTLQGMIFLAKAVKNPLSEEHAILTVIAAQALYQIQQDYSAGDVNERARMVGKGIGEVILCFGGGTLTTETLKVISRSDRIAAYVARMNSGTMTLEDARISFNVVAADVSKIDNALAGVEENRMHHILYGSTGNESGHAWEVLFDGTNKPTFNEIKPIIKEAYVNGTIDESDVITDYGIKYTKKYTYNSHRIWVEVVEKNDGSWSVVNAGVNID